MSDDFNRSVNDKDIEDILNFVREKNSEKYNNDNDEKLYDTSANDISEEAETDFSFDEPIKQDTKPQQPEIPKLASNKDSRIYNMGDTREVAELFRGAQLFPDTTSIIISDLAEAEFKKEQERDTETPSQIKESDMSELFGSDLTYSKEIDIFSIVSRLNSYNEVEDEEDKQPVEQSDDITESDSILHSSNGSDFMKDNDKIGNDENTTEDNENNEFRHLDIGSNDNMLSSDFTDEYDNTDNAEAPEISAEMEAELSDSESAAETENGEIQPDDEIADEDIDEIDNDDGNTDSDFDGNEENSDTPQADGDKKSFNKKWLIIPIAAVIILLFSISAFFMAVSNKNKDNTPSAVESEPMLDKMVSEVESAVESVTSSEVSSVASEPEIYTGEYSRLTGLPIDDKDLNIRPVAVMINNIEAAQPLLGISKADIVYECIVEGGITRLLAVFGNPQKVDTIGSVRSSRPDFIYLAKGLDAVYFHVGTSTQAQALLDTGIITSFDLGMYGSMSWRDNYRMNYLGYEHSLVTSGKSISQGLKDYDVRTDSDTDKGMKFSDTPSSISGDKATNMNVVFSSYKSTSFEYSSKKKVYTVNQFGAAQYDSEYSVNNTVSNVLVIRTDVYQIDDEGHMSFDVIGSGSGYYMSGGRVINITWQKSSSSDPIHYYTSDGKELEMMRGKSYVCIIPRDSDVSYWS